MNVSKEFFNNLFNEVQEARREILGVRLSKAELEHYLRIARRLDISKSELVRKALAHFDEVNNHE